MFNLSIIFISLNRGRKWNESLVKPNLNYQDFFHGDVGQEPGKLEVNSELNSQTSIMKQENLNGIKQVLKC